MHGVEEQQQAKADTLRRQIAEGKSRGTCPARAKLEVVRSRRVMQTCPLLLTLPLLASMPRLNLTPAHPDLVRIFRWLPIYSQLLPT